MGLGSFTDYFGANGWGGGGAAAGGQDPATAAYLRALGFSDQQAQAQGAKQIADINAQAQFQQPEIDYQGQLAQQAVQQDALGRGVWGSGERLMNEAQAAHVQQYQTGKLQMNQAQSVGDAQLAMARALADNEARRQTYLAQTGAVG